MLTKIGIRNFKLFDERGADIDLARITVFIGANGTGKSTPLQALAWLKQSAEVPTGFVPDMLKFSGPYVDLGGLTEILHNGDSHAPFLEIYLEANYHLPQEVIIDEPDLPHDGYIFYGLTLGRNIHLLRGGIRGLTEPEAKSPLVFYGADDSAQRVFKAGNSTVSVVGDDRIGHPFRIAGGSRGRLPGDIRRSLWDTVQEMAELIPNVLADYTFVPAIRGFDELGYAVSRRDDVDVDNPNDRAAARAADAANTLASKPELLEEVSTYLAKVLGTDRRLAFRVAGERIEQLTVRGRQTINLVNEAFGLNQLVIPLFSLCSVPPGSLVGHAANR